MSRCYKQWLLAALLATADPVFADYDFRQVIEPRSPEELQYITEADKAKLQQFSRMDEKQRALVADFVDAIREEAAKAGVEPETLFPPSFTGFDGAGYRQSRLDVMKAKREAKAREVEALKKKQAERLAAGLTRYERLTENDAVRAAQSLSGITIDVQRFNRPPALQNETTAFSTSRPTHRNDGNEFSDCFDEGGQHVGTPGSQME